MSKKFALLAFSALTAAAVMAGSSKPAAACGTEAYTGQVCIMAGNYCPYNTVEAIGQTLNISQYQALYSLVGTIYGGDARTTFGVPDLRGRVPSGYGPGPGLTNRAVGTKYGVEGVVQTLAMLATHNHTATFVPTGGTSATMAVNVPAVTGTLAVNSTPNLTATGTANVTLNNDTKAMIGTATTTSRSNTISDKAVLTSATLGNANIYQTGATHELEIGPAGAVTGTATGTVNSTVSGTISNTVTGSAPLPAFTIQVPYTAGNVAVNTAGGSQAMPTLSPSIAMRYCLVTEGIYPQRP